MKQTLTALAFATAAITFSTASALAEGPNPAKHEQLREKLQNMTPEQRQQFKQERKEKWESLSDADKVKIIEKRRAAKMKEREAHWQSLSDAEKIKQVEQRIKHKKKRHAGKPE